MEKIDRLGWAAGLSMSAYGVRVGVRVNQAEALDKLQEHLPPGWKPSRVRSVEQLYSVFIGGSARRRGVRSFNLVYANAVRVGRSLQLDEVLEVFESNLQLHVAERSRQRLFIHAGVVGWKGRAILIPGRSFSGKTTLVAELVKAGASYYSDEYALVDSRGRIHPYAKPLSIREGDAHKQEKWPPEALGGTRGRKPLRPGMVVNTHYKPGARWRPPGSPLRCPIRSPRGSGSYTLFSAASPV